MKDIINKSFNGLSKQYYLRQLFFSFAITVLYFILPQQISFAHILFAIVCLFLYPYSRFVYETVFEFILGNNVFFTNAIVLLIAKLFTMLACWFFSIFIAPVGLLYLYFYNSKTEKKEV